jgi:heme-degrading monooxygenase HmoA
MLRHIVMWNYKDGFTEAENKLNAERVKYELESLTSFIDGIVELNVYINELSSSNKDVILNSLFESEEALAAYQVHPEHRRVSAFVGTVLRNRACFDYLC